MLLGSWIINALFIRLSPISQKFPEQTTVVDVCLLYAVWFGP